MQGRRICFGHMNSGWSFGTARKGRSYISQLYLNHHTLNFYTHSHTPMPQSPLLSASTAGQPEHKANGFNTTESMFQQILQTLQKSVSGTP